MTQARLDLDTRSAERAAGAQARAQHRGPVTLDVRYGTFTTTVYAKIGAGEYPVGELTIDLDAPDDAGPVVRYSNRSDAVVGPAPGDAVECTGAGTCDDPCECRDNLNAARARAEAAQRRAAGGAPNTTPGGAIDAPTAAERAAAALEKAAAYAGESVDFGTRASLLTTVAGGYRDLAVAMATVDGLTRPTDPEGARR